MAEDDLTRRIFADAPRYQTPVTGSFFTLKSAAYSPWELNRTSTGRFNDLGTGSLYLGSTLMGCINEVGTEGKVAYEVDTGALFLTKILDLARWCREHTGDCGSLLIESASAGWEPTLEISCRAREEGYQGVLYVSRFSPTYTNLVVWEDKVHIEEKAFARLPSSSGWATEG